MQLFVQMSPILAGAIFMLVVKEVRLPEARIQIRFSDESALQKRSEEKETGFREHNSATGLPVSCSEAYVNKELGEAHATYFYASLQDRVVLWRGYLGSLEDMHAGVFKRVVYDELILNGLLEHRFGTDEIYGVAFDKLGIMDIDKVRELDSYLKNHKKGRLSIFTPDCQIMLKHLLSFDNGCGFLLPYLIDYNMEIIGV